MCFYEEFKSGKFTDCPVIKQAKPGQISNNLNDMEQNLIQQEQEPNMKQKKRCCAGYKEMTCNRKVKTQRQLYDFITTSE